ncbi:heptosyltransferase-2 [Cetobacterium ceti]|uniref:Heptosyltransferase-2 n=1 Tax=Cetobacterium ceti TaxID=180163 RepID=A0A1T4PMV2_9FUSO|nr:glycosyltransferase family 9 protein [Cetobacterium ceti]SJZ92915.1 heptosyltransferase-2 [Cetobacterium ceti]
MRILIIHTAFIGDIVLSTPMIKALKEKYPQSEITYVTTPAGASILRNNPYLSEIIAYDKRGAHRGIKGVYELGKRLRYKNFNMVITPHRYLRSAVLSWLTRAPIRKGYDKSAGSFLYTEKVPYVEHKHEVEKLLGFVDENISKRYEIELYPSKENEDKVKTLLNGREKNKKIVMVAPGSKWFTKKWPLEYFNVVLENLNRKEDILTVVVGGKEELTLNIVKGDNILDLRGKTTLLDMAQLASKSELILTNDSSPIHIGSAFKDTHIVAIFGPTVREFGFFPWSKNSEVLEVKNLKCRPCSIHGGDKCPKGHFRCMLDITPDKVLERVEDYLKREK